MARSCPSERSSTNDEQKAIGIVQKAIDEDVKQNYAEAYKLYQDALDYFMMVSYGHMSR